MQAPSAEEERMIIALSAQISDLKTDTFLTETSIAFVGEQGKKYRAARFVDKYARTRVPPAAGESTTKDVDRKSYHFCMHHNSEAGTWVIHDPNKCDRVSKKETKATIKSDVVDQGLARHPGRGLRVVVRRVEITFSRCAGWLLIWSNLDHALAVWSTGAVVWVAVVR
jgi:hypothetical protein